MRDNGGSCSCLCIVAIIAVMIGSMVQNEMTPEAKVRREVIQLRKEKEAVLWEKERARLKKFLKDERSKVENE